MDQLNKQLEQLALEAQRHPPKTNARRLALTRLIQKIKASGKLSFRRNSEFPPEVYEEAMQEFWLYFCRKIDNYNPEKGAVIHWVNFTIKRRLIDANNRHTKKGKEQSLDAPINHQSSSSSHSKLTPLEILAQPEETTLPSQKVRKCLEEDLEGLFVNKHIRGKPQANFRAIALLYLDKKTWQETAVAVQLKPGQASTVQSFYWRCCQYFADKFKEYLQS